MKKSEKKKKNRSVLSLFWCSITYERKILIGCGLYYLMHTLLQDHITEQKAISGVSQSINDAYAYYSLVQS